MMGMSTLERPVADVRYGIGNAACERRSLTSAFDEISQARRKLVPLHHQGVTVIVTTIRPTVVLPCTT